MDCTKSNTYIVTGATGGIGSAIVESLVARQVPRIVLAVRNEEAGAELARTYAQSATEVTVARLDLASFSSVREFAARMSADGIGVKALINNAGMLARHKTVTADGYEATMQVNFLAPVLLTHLLLPRMTHDSSVIFTTSFMRRVGYIEPAWKDMSLYHYNRFAVYSWSKLMLAQVARVMAPKLAVSGIRVNCTDPGIVNTEILRLGNSFVDSMADHLLRPAIRTPRQAAEATMHALDSRLFGQVFTRHGHKAIAMRDNAGVSEKAVADMLRCNAQA